LHYGELFNSENLLKIRKKKIKSRNLEKIHKTLESTKLKEIHIIKKRKNETLNPNREDEAIPSVVIREQGFSKRSDLVGSNIRKKCVSRSLNLVGI
jgi:hypothetical protein